MTSRSEQPGVLGWLVAPSVAVLIVAVVSSGFGHPLSADHGVHEGIARSARTNAVVGARVEGVTVEREQLTELEAQVHSLQEENAALRDAMRVALERLAVLNAAEVPQVAESAPHS